MGAVFLDMIAVLCCYIQRVMLYLLDAIVIHGCFPEMNLPHRVGGLLQNHRWKIFVARKSFEQDFDSRFELPWISDDGVLEKSDQRTRGQTTKIENDTRLKNVLKAKLNESESWDGRRLRLMFRISTRFAFHSIFHLQEPFLSSKRRVIRYRKLRKTGTNHRNAISYHRSYYEKQVMRQFCS